MYKYIALSVILVLCAPGLLAKRDREGRRQGGGGASRQNLRGCQWSFGECQFKEAGAVCGAGTKLGTAQNEECPVREKQFKCRVECGCRYKPAAGQTSACDPATKTKTINLELVSGDPAKCAKTTTKTKPCRVREVRDANSRRAERRREGANREAGENTDCKYKKGAKGECDPVTLKRTITMELKKKSPATCPPTKTITKDCKVKGERGERGGDRGRNNRRKPKQI